MAFLSTPWCIQRTPISYEGANVFDILGAEWGKEANSSIIHHVYLHLIPTFSLNITLFSTMPGLPESETCLVQFLQRINPCSPVRVWEVTDTWMYKVGEEPQGSNLFSALHLFPLHCLYL